MSDEELEREYEKAISKMHGEQYCHRYILDDADEPVPCHDLMTWAHWTENASENGQRFLRKTVTRHYTVHTTFLGLNHCWGNGPPLLWETMVSYPHKHKCGNFELNDGWCDYQERYSTRLDAIVGHVKAEEWAAEHFRWYRRWGRAIKHFAERVRNCLAYKGDPG